MYITLMIKVRRLVTIDSADYYNLRLRGLTLNPEAFGAGAEAFSKTTAEQAKSMIESFDNDDFILGSFRDNQLIGVVGYLREKKHSISHKATTWGLMVLPEFRNNGAGRLLIQNLIEIASTQEGIEHIRAIVTITPSNAIKLFQSIGFKQYGLESRGIKCEENYYDQSYLMLDIRK